MSSANAAVSAEPWSTVTFLNVMGSSGGTDDRSYVDIVNAYTANAAGRRAAHARDCSIKERSVDAQAFVPSCSPLSISHPDAAVVKLLSSAQSVALQPSHFVTASWSTKVPVIGHLSSDTCVHIRITVSSNSNTDIFDSLACRLDQARVPSLVSSSSPEIDISYPAFNQVMRACASLISADVSAAERLHLVLTNKEKCGLLLSKLRHVIEDGGRGDVDDNDEGGQSRLGLLSPTFIHRKSIGMDNFKIMQAPRCLWIADAAAAAAVLSLCSELKSRAVATFGPLLQRNKQQSVYAAMVLDHRSALRVAAAAVRCLWQQKFKLSQRLREETQKQDMEDQQQLVVHSAATTISRVTRAFVLRLSSWSRPGADEVSESLESAAASTVASAYVLRCAKRTTWSKVVIGIRALERVTSGRRGRFEAIAAAASVAGCVGRMKKEGSDVWMTMADCCTLKMFSSEMSVVPLRVAQVEKGGGLRAWGGGWRVVVDSDCGVDWGDAFECDSGGDDDGTLFHIEIRTPRKATSPSASICLTFPHPLSPSPSSKQSRVSCLLLLKKIIFAYICMQMPPPPLPFAFRSCSNLCHAIRQVNAMETAALVASASDHDSHHRTHSERVITGSSSNLIARVAAAHVLSQAASRTVLSLRRIIIMRRIVGLQCRMRALGVHRSWRCFVMSIKRTVTMSGVLRIVAPSISSEVRQYHYSRMLEQRGSMMKPSCTLVLQAISPPSSSTQPPSSSSLPSSLSSSASTLPWARYHQPSSFRNPAFSLYQATTCRLR